MMPLCDSGCGTELTAPPNDAWEYWCSTCHEAGDGWRHPFTVREFNDTEKQIWLRSNAVSYSTVLKKGLLLPNGEVRGMKDFKWEKWP